MAIEQPISYIETNSASPEYQLTGSFEQQYGILHIEKNIKNSQLIRQSVYWKILSSLSENKNGLSKYLGSPALALNILKASTNKFVFFDIEEMCLKQIAVFVKKLNINSKITYKNQDSVDGLIGMLEELGTRDFIHVDPYFIHHTNANEHSYFDAFCLAMRKGVMGMLWYGFNTIKEREVLHNVFSSQTNTSSQTRLQGIEIASILLNKNILDVNPGVLGCGILIGNLSEDSRQSFKEMAQEVINLYRDSTMFDKYPGELKLKEFEIQI
ncbi:23S rRNA (adenine(2030)-N(6))-methyltransferase RlmJ [Brasilonema bromeliae]|uniref:23S rRNA (adenine(2030)-N(6))-methyltransferase RlmJ n=1 Tax=Brasilonema bromeliae TaxID=383615 RepID=UPI001B7CE173|nr:23S rRNA (adenine(2030)-N(6))-methyltransferase RlmJ [Brasilonema bromeliae]